MTGGEGLHGVFNSSFAFHEHADWFVFGVFFFCARLEGC